MDIRAILEEQAEQLIEFLDIPEVQVAQRVDNERGDLLETLIDEILGLQETQGSTESEKSLENQQLITLLSEALPAAPRNTAHRGNEISGDLDPQNIVQSSRT